MGGGHNVSQHVNSISANVGIDFLMFVLKSHSGKGQYSMMLRKTIHLLWTWFCLNKATGSFGDQCATIQGLGSLFYFETSNSLWKHFFEKFFCLITCE